MSTDKAVKKNIPLIDRIELLYYLTASLIDVAWRNPASILCAGVTHAGSYLARRKIAHMTHIERIGYYLGVNLESLADEKVNEPSQTQVQDTGFLRIHKVKWNGETKNIILKQSSNEGEILLEQLVQRYARAHVQFEGVSVPEVVKYDHRFGMISTFEDDVVPLSRLQKEMDTSQKVAVMEKLFGYFHAFNSAISSRDNDLFQYVSGSRFEPARYNTTITGAPEFNLRDSAARIPWRQGNDYLVHGDLHPGNILVRDNGELIILDFARAHKGHPYEDLYLFTTKFAQDAHEQAVLEQKGVEMLFGRGYCEDDTIHQLLYQCLVSIERGNKLWGLAKQATDAMLGEEMNEEITHIEEKSQWFYQHALDLALAVDSIRPSISKPIFDLISSEVALKWVDEWSDQSQWNPSRWPELGYSMTQDRMQLGLIEEKVFEREQDESFCSFLSTEKMRNTRLAGLSTYSILHNASIYWVIQHEFGRELDENKVNFSYFGSGLEAPAIFAGALIAGEGIRRILRYVVEKKYDRVLKLK